MSMRLISLCVAGLLVASSARAAVLPFEFEGVVTANTGNKGIFGPPSSVQIDDPFTGRFSYEVGPGNPDQVPADPTQGAYHLLSFEIDQAVVPITPIGLLIVHEPGLLTFPPAPPDPGTDGVLVVGTYPDGEITRPVSLRLVAHYGDVFSDVSLPLDLSLTDFPVAHDVRAIVTVGLPDGPPGQADVGLLTGLVLIPEPGMAVLIGLGGLLVRLRGRSDRSGRATGGVLAP